jgi:hypothetical protein
VWRSYALGVRQRPVSRAFVVWTLAIAICGCSGSHNAARSTTQVAGPRFVAASRVLFAKCRATARVVGYAVPCPTRIPAGLYVGPTAPNGRCSLNVIGAGGGKGCGNSWRGWVIGSSYSNDEHLVITASPKRLTNDAKLINGPAWYPQARVRPLGRVQINGWRMHAVYAPPETNDGSAFMHHVVLIWTKDGHTYGVGFHNVRGIQRTLTLDEELAGGIRLVGPNSGEDEGLETAFLMNSAAAVKRACAAIRAGTKRQRAHWRVVCPPKIPRVSQPSVIYFGGAAATSNFRPGYGLDGTGSIYPIVNGYGHWTFRSGSPPLLERLLHPTDTIGRPESTVSAAQKMLVAGQKVLVYRVAPEMTEYAGHVVVAWIDRGQAYQVSVHRWKSDRQGLRQAIGMVAAIIRQIRASK